MSAANKTGVTPEAIAAAHRKRLAAWGITSSDRYTAEVVACALSDPPPWMHSHAFEEMGMCTDCDAATALESVLMDAED